VSEYMKLTRDEERKLINTVRKKEEGRGVEASL